MSRLENQQDETLQGLIGLVMDGKFDPNTRKGKRLWGEILQYYNSQDNQEMVETLLNELHDAHTYNTLLTTGELFSTLTAGFGTLLLGGNPGAGLRLSSKVGNYFRKRSIEYYRSKLVQA